MKEVLGETAFNNYIELKAQEFQIYSAQVLPMGIEALYSSILKIFSICCLFFSLSVYFTSFVIWIRYILSCNNERTFKESKSKFMHGAKLN